MRNEDEGKKRVQLITELLQSTCAWHVRECELQRGLCIHYRCGEISADYFSTLVFIYMFLICLNIIYINLLRMLELRRCLAKYNLSVYTVYTVLIDSIMYWLYIVGMIWCPSYTFICMKLQWTSMHPGSEESFNQRREKEIFEWSCVRQLCM